MPARVIRLATAADAVHVHAIYAPIVRDTAISFEWEVPTVEDVRGRIERTIAAGFPWLVAEAVGKVSGYAYASAFRARTAYSWTAEVSVYVHPQHHRRGVGSALYRRLLQLLELQGYRSAYAVSTTPNAGSEHLHRNVGFEQVGHFPRVGRKFGQWHDVLCWRIPLGDADAAPAQIRTVGDVAGAGHP